MAGIKPVRGVDNFGNHSDVIYMASYVTGIALIQYKAMGHLINDRVLIIESDGQIMAHALSVNLIGVGETTPDAISALEDIIEVYFENITDPNSHLINSAEKSLFDLWQKIFEKTSTSGQEVFSSAIKKLPNDMREPIPA